MYRWINAWKSGEDRTEEIFKNAIESIKSDIRAWAKYNSSMNSEQRTLLHGVLRKIIEALKTRNIMIKKKCSPCNLM